MAQSHPKRRSLQPPTNWVGKKGRRCEAVEQCYSAAYPHSSSRRRCRQIINRVKNPFTLIDNRVIEKKKGAKKLLCPLNIGKLTFCVSLSISILIFMYRQ